MAVSPDGKRVAVTGESGPTEGRGDFTTVVYDATRGTRLWVRRYQESGPGGRAVAFAPNGKEVFVTGHAVTIAYKASTGDRAWLSKYASGKGTDDTYLLAVAPDGTRAYVTGSTCPPSGLCDFTTVAYGT